MEETNQERYRVSRSNGLALHGPTWETLGTRKYLNLGLNTHVRLVVRILASTTEGHSLFPSILEMLPAVLLKTNTK